jgi:hypothetical protein
MNTLTSGGSTRRPAIPVRDLWKVCTASLLATHTKAIPHVRGASVRVGRHRLSNRVPAKRWWQQQAARILCCLRRAPTSHFPEKIKKNLPFQETNFKIISWFKKNVNLYSDRHCYWRPDRQGYVCTVDIFQGWFFANMLLQKTPAANKWTPIFMFELN